MGKKKLDLMGHMKESKKQQLIRIIAFTAAIMLVSGPLSMNIGENFSSQDMLSTNTASAESLEDDSIGNDDDSTDETLKEPREPKNPKEPRDPKEPKQPRDPKEPLDPKEPRDPKQPGDDEAEAEDEDGTEDEGETGDEDGTEDEGETDDGDESDDGDGADIGTRAADGDSNAAYAFGTPEVNGVFTDDTKLSGTGFTRATVKVTDEAGNVLGTALASEDGKFTVDLNRALVAGEELIVTQSAEDSDGDLNVSGPATVIIQETDTDDDSNGDSDDDSDRDADAYEAGYLAGFADGESGVDIDSINPDEDYLDGYLAGFADGQSDGDFDRNIFPNGPPSTKAGYVRPGDDQDSEDDDDRAYPFGFGGPGDEYGNGPPNTKAGYVEGDILGLGGPGEGMDAYGEDIGDQDNSDDNGMVVLGENGPRDGMVTQNEASSADSDHELPNTATSKFSWLLVGLMVLIAGAVGLFMFRPKKCSIK